MFVLSLKLGNEAMQTREDIAGALRDVAERVERGASNEGAIRDVNGNTVGRWHLHVGDA